MKTRYKTLKKVVLVAASGWYDKLVNIYTTQYDKLTKTQKKRLKVQNMPENLPADFYLDPDENCLPPMPPLEDDEKLKLEPEETIAERVKLNSQKRKNEETGLKILTPISY